MSYKTDCDAVKVTDNVTIYMIKRRKVKMLCNDDTPMLYADPREMRRKIELIGEYVREVEERLSAHDSIMAAVSAGGCEMSDVCEAIGYARDALLRLRRISEAMESIGGEVTRLRWEICKARRCQSPA